MLEGAKLLMMNWCASFLCVEFSSVSTRGIEEGERLSGGGSLYARVSCQKGSIRSPSGSGICIDEGNRAHSLMSSFARSSIGEACVWRTEE